MGIMSSLLCLWVDLGDCLCRFDNILGLYLSYQFDTIKMVE